MITSEVICGSLSHFVVDHRVRRNCCCIHVRHLQRAYTFTTDTANNNNVMSSNHNKTGMRRFPTQKSMLAGGHILRRRLTYVMCKQKDSERERERQRKTACGSAQNYCETNCSWVSRGSSKSHKNVVSKWREAILQTAGSMSVAPARRANIDSKWPFLWCCLWWT